MTKWMNNQSSVSPDPGLGGGIASAASIVVMSIALSRGLGFVRQAVINARFGVGAEADAWFAAFRIPDTVFMLLAGGALVSALIPVYAEVKARGEPEALYRLLCGVASLVLFATIVLAALGVLLAVPLMAVITPGFDASTKMLAVETSRWLMLSPVVLALSAVVKAALQSERKFLLPALSPVFYNVGIILGAVFLSYTFGLMGLVWGTLIGVCLHIGIQLPGVLVYRVPRVMLGYNNPDVLRVLRLMWPRLLGVAVLQASLIAVTILASTHGSSSVAAINNGFMLMLLPLGIFAMSLGEASLPELSERWATGDRKTFALRMSGIWRYVVFLTIPSAVGLVVLAEPLVAVLFQRGAFDVRATELTAMALRCFSIGLVGHAVVEILIRGFFAMQDTRTPVVVGSISLLVHVALSWLLGLWIGIGGIALGVSVGVLVEASLLVLILWRRSGFRLGAEEIRSMFSAVAAALIMGAIVAILRMLTWSSGVVDVGSVLLLLLYVVLALGMYMLFMTLLGSAELLELRTRMNVRARVFGRRR
ncbi:MAG TPA: murein biosynthesis integral membrane protein MurJ [Chloroflexi bacterium]|nr:murein biosynthesis integral membrane protein MurJ [Chloroflexota bacterium]|tara:strand:- start:103 stop:1707 length:1605 start_codon:yes stop_codon:yes gene_type:complete